MAGGNWVHGLTTEQSVKVREIRKPHMSGRDHESNGSWTFYTEPTVGPARYCELRWYINGAVLRWVIDRTGGVIARATSRGTREMALARLAVK